MHGIISGRAKVTPPLVAGGYRIICFRGNSSSREADELGPSSTLSEAIADKEDTAATISRPGQIRDDTTTAAQPLSTAFATSVAAEHRAKTNANRVKVREEARVGLLRHAREVVAGKDVSSQAPVQPLFSIARRQRPSSSGRPADWKSEVIPTLAIEQHRRLRALRRRASQNDPEAIEALRAAELAMEQKDTSSSGKTSNSAREESRSRDDSERASGTEQQIPRTTLAVIGLLIVGTAYGLLTAGSPSEPSGTDGSSKDDVDQAITSPLSVTVRPDESKVPLTTTAKSSQTDSIPGNDGPSEISAGVDDLGTSSSNTKVFREGSDIRKVQKSAQGWWRWGRGQSAPTNAGNTVVRDAGGRDGTVGQDSIRQDNIQNMRDSGAKDAEEETLPLWLRKPRARSSAP